MDMLPSMTDQLTKYLRTSHDIFREFTKYFDVAKTVSKNRQALVLLLDRRFPILTKARKLAMQDGTKELKTDHKEKKQDPQNFKWCIVW